MTQHEYNPECDCDPCFAVWRAETEVKKSVAREEGERRYQERMRLLKEIVEHFAVRRVDPRG